jgi:phosphoribosylaminoimidazole carboxylase
MLADAAHRMGIKITVLDSGPTPAKTTTASIDGKYTDAACVIQLASKCDVMTIEIEHVDANVLDGLTCAVHPSATTIRTIQDKYAQKLHLHDGGIALGPFREIKSGDAQTMARQLEAIGDEFGFPFMLKSKTLAYDGKGNYKVSSSSDIPSAVSEMTRGGKEIYAEKWVPFKKELAVMVAKSINGEVVAYPYLSLI